jgi:Outer membrane protein beta-barrel domain
MLYKSTFSLLIGTLFFCTLNAQTEKGTFSIGGNISPKILAHKDKDNNRIEYHGELQGGYFVTRNWLLGSEISMTRFRVKTNGEINLETNTYRVGAFTRKYFDIGQTKWKPFVGISGGYAFKQSKEQNPVFGSNNFDKGGLYVNGEIGIAYFIGNKTSIHVSNYMLYDFLGDKSNASLSLLKLGVTHNFDGKNKNE